MRILAIETSGRRGSAALLQTDDAAATVDVVGQAELPADRRTASALLPAIGELLAAARWRAADVDLVAVTTGPGSFTGLRIGVVAAKTFAYALGAKLVGVHTLAAMAEGGLAFAGYRPPRRLWTVLDAQRQELFAACFDGERPVVDQVQPATTVITVDDWLTSLRADDAVAGPPLAKLAVRLPAGVAVLPERLWPPAAAAVGRLGAAMYWRGIESRPLELVPQYYRPSAAEEKSRRV